MGTKVTWRRQADHNPFSLSLSSCFLIFFPWNISFSTNKRMSQGIAGRINGAGKVAPATASQSDQRQLHQSRFRD
jgi:hypothetical protein